jgi:hypothetical protein
MKVKDAGDYEIFRGVETNMAHITYLNNADIDVRSNKIIVTMRTGGTPSSPQPQQRVVLPREGQTIEQLEQELIGAYLDENGE